MYGENLTLVSDTSGAEFWSAIARWNVGFEKVSVVCSIISIAAKP